MICYNNRAHFRMLFSNNTTFLNFHNSYSTIQQVKKSADELQYDRPDFLSGRLSMTFISGPRNPPGYWHLGLSIAYDFNPLILN